MCFDHDSAPPIAGGDRAITTANRTLTADDGNEFLAFAATGSEASPAAVVVLPDVRGLFQFYKDLAARFAEAGHDTIAIDYFGRTAGLGARSNDWDYMPHVRATTLEGIKADVASAVRELRRDAPDRAIFTVGFCFGGSNSWHQAANGFGLAGAIGFYGHPNRSTEPITVMDRIGDIDCPVMALMGGDDPGIPRDDVDAFEAALNESGIANEVVVYDGAPHSFFDRKYAEFADASADAWRRVLEFIAGHS